MTRDKAIERWKEIAHAVLWAEEKIALEWDKRLKAAPKLSKDEQAKFIDEYMTAIATVVVSQTSDEELAKLE